MIFVDTGYFLGLISPGDDLAVRVAQWEMQIREPLLTSEFVWLELADALSSPRNRSIVRPFFSSLRQEKGIEIVSVSSALFEKGLRFYDARNDKNWSLTDCISFVLMQERGISRALAFDHHFEQAGFEALLRREP
ncbi:MAG TPA: PIN domain-containing protein [Abditibacterium sp.]|jgi:hypothetical protein